MTIKPFIWTKPATKYDKSINIKMTVWQYEQFLFAAKKLQMTKSDLVRTALTEYCDKHL